MELLGCYLLKRMKSKNSLIKNPPLSNSHFLVNFVSFVQVETLSRDSQPNIENKFCLHSIVIYDVGIVNALNWHLKYS